MKLFYTLYYIVFHLYRNTQDVMFMAFLEHQEVQV